MSSSLFRSLKVEMNDAVEEVDPVLELNCAKENNKFSLERKRDILCLLNVVLQAKETIKRKQQLQKLRGTLIRKLASFTLCGVCGSMSS